MVATRNWLNGTYNCEHRISININIKALIVTIEQYDRPLTSYVDEEALTIIHDIYSNWQQGGSIEDAVQNFVNTLNIKKLKDEDN